MSGNEYANLANGNAIRRSAVRVMAGIGAMQCAVAHAQDASGQADSDEDLAEKLSNPVAALISVPFQYNHDDNIGPSDDFKDYLNIQPAIPVTLNPDLNRTARTIVPLVDLHDLPRNGDSSSGLGDVSASQFFSAKQPTSSGSIGGAGPVELLPTASDRTLGTGKWGLGPTFVALKQVAPITYGVLANHIWSVAGDSNRNSVNSTLVQPFFAYVTKTTTTLYPK